MAITPIAGATATGNTAAPTATLGGTPTDGELLVAYLSVNAVTAVWTLANGWAYADDSTDRIDNTDQAVMLWKVASGETTSMAPITLNATRNWALCVERFSSTATSAPLESTGTLGRADDTATKTTPTTDPTDGVERLIACGAMSTGANRAFSSQQVNGSATGVSSLSAASVGNSTTCTLWWLVVASTAAGNYSGTVSCATTEAGAAHIGAFLPVSTAGMPPGLGTSLHMSLPMQMPPP